MPTREQLELVHLPCPRCSHDNAFEAAEVTGPLGIFCVECGSAFDRVLLTRIRNALQKKPAHANAGQSAQGKFTDNVHAPSGRWPNSVWDLR
jgi:hypothetical protein